MRTKINTMVDSYDIIFYGAETRSDQLDGIKDRVAKILRINDQKLETLFSRWGGVVLKHGVSPEGAEKTKEILTDAGALCFLRKSEQAKHAATSKQKFHIPDMSRVRSWLLTHRRILVLLALAITTAACFGIAGIPWSSTIEGFDKSRGKLEQPRSGVSVKKVSRKASTIEFSSSRQATKQVANIAGTLSDVQQGYAENTGMPQRTLFSFEKTHSTATALLAEIAADREWDISLVAVVQTLLESGRLEHAFKIGDHIVDGMQRFKTLGEITYHYASRGEKGVATAKLNGLKQEIATIADRTRQVVMLCELATFHKRAGNLIASQQVFQEARDLAKVIRLPLKKSISLGYIAATQTRLDLGLQADSTFQEANAIMSTVPGLRRRLQGYIQLASSYASAGDKNGTLNVLHAALKSTNKLSAKKDRSALLAEISLLNARIGGHTAALDAAGMIEAPIDRDKAIYQLLTEQIASDNLYAAMASAEKLEQSIYEAKAFALLARFQKGSPLEPLGKENFEHAMDSASTLTDPVIQSIILSEIARYHMRSEEEATARELMTLALGLAKQMDNLQNRDLAFAAIAKNQALASLLAEADRTATLIDSQPLKTSILYDISKIRQTIYALKVVQVPLNI